MGQPSGGAAERSREPVLLRERSVGPLYRAVLVWAMSLLSLTWATEHLARHIGGVGVAFVWTGALMCGMLAARVWRGAIRRRPRLLLLRRGEVALLDRAGREIARQPTERVRVQRACHRVGAAGVRTEPALSVRLPGLRPLVIGALGLGHPLERGSAFTRPSYLVGPDEWRALVRGLDLEPAG